MDFVKEPADSERRTQTGTGIFQDYFITKRVGGEDVHIHMILLDNRYSYDKKRIDLLGEA